MRLWSNYFLEIKYRISLIVFTWFSSMTICYCYKDVLVYLLIYFSNYHLTFYNLKSHFIFTDVTELFSIYFAIILFISNQILYISIFYHIVIFLSSGLYKYEYKNLILFFKVFLLVWLIFCFIFNYFILPFSWNFFLSFQMKLSSISLLFEAKLKEYINFYISFFYVCLINSQFVIFIFSLIINLINNLSKIKTFRRLFYFIFMLFSTVLTPPDVFSQLTVSFLLIIFYEIFILVKIFNILIRKPVKTN